METTTAHQRRILAGWYVLTYMGRPPQAMITEIRLHVRGAIHTFRLQQNYKLTAEEAAGVLAVELPAGLVLAYTGPPAPPDYRLG
jgi:hypothetical protein